MRQNQDQSAEYLSPEIALALFGISLLAGFVDSIAGGGGLLALPALLWAGLIRPLLVLVSLSLSAQLLSDQLI